MTQEDQIKLFYAIDTEVFSEEEAETHHRWTRWVNGGSKCVKCKLKRVLERGNIYYPGILTWGVPVCVESQGSQKKKPSRVSIGWAEKDIKLPGSTVVGDVKLGT